REVLRPEPVLRFVRVKADGLDREQDQSRRRQRADRGKRHRRRAGLGWDAKLAQSGPEHRSDHSEVTRGLSGHSVFRFWTGARLDKLSQPSNGEGKIDA